MRTDKKLWRNRKTKKELARRLQSENRGPEGGAEWSKNSSCPLPTHEPHFKRRFMINQARQTLCLGQTARILIFV
jgi:hypothetical protein